MSDVKLDNYQTGNAFIDLKLERKQLGTKERRKVHQHSSRHQEKYLHLKDAKKITSVFL